ncbi:deoxyribodipyrimidine photo-lyase [Paracoccus sp. (in: a-proteobacteria)]|uniref:cryptochrome/photolyase family protein n=1 Tax=Paracoccus sp. TaxID=267 RepID=UPI0026E0A3FF|nr:deoxyribodipyrimidine photo-lyase [Paracoccus sp. (in: a-proteobacteria)]MDO5647593.1 deoxyribodipyrimidine photo-lyase [Paracoccus sp. (in: a-proteobacteria)]
MTVICWFRRVLRLDDHPALIAAAQSGAVIPVVILSGPEATATPASAQRQAMALPALDAALRRQGSRLIVRRGDPATVLADLMRDSGADHIHTTTGFPFAADDLDLPVSYHPLGDLVSRGTVLTKTGGIFRVFSPFWKALRQHDIAPPLPAPRLTAPDQWPDSDAPDWPEARSAMRRGWDVVAEHITAGEDAALSRLDTFLDDAVTAYKDNRNDPWRDGATSNLSDSLAVGEISARRIWHRCQPLMQDGVPGVDHFLSELAWREFARELFHDMPAMDRQNWRPEWNDFPWRSDNDDACAWRRGQTGVDMVDAGMRELFATGRMHNRVRMIAASYLTKHLLTDWRVGLDWFAQTLTDWDPASNAMNWQWVAGCGPDAAPYFRIFNPDTQGDKFDPKSAYRNHWLRPMAAGALQFEQAAPLSWRINLAHRPKPSLTLADGRERALAAYARLKD